MYDESHLEMRFLLQDLGIIQELLDFTLKYCMYSLLMLWAKYCIVLHKFPFRSHLLEKKLFLLVHVFLAC
jgi:hypothetical protein